MAIFTEHYRQPVSELSVVAYAEDLQKLTPEQLDAACLRARQTSEFMPVSAVILKAHDELISMSREEFLGVPQLSYPPPEPMTPAELVEHDKQMAEVKRRLGIELAKPRTVSPARKLRIVPSTLSIDEQKRKLRERGFLR